MQGGGNGFRKINPAKLDHIIWQLQSKLERGCDTYGAINQAVVEELNRLFRGAVRKIETDELRDQIGHLIYYQIKEIHTPVPLDLEYVEFLWSHFRNPTVIVLKRIRKHLMASHRNILSRLEDQQAAERGLDLRYMDVNQVIRDGLNEMQRFQTMARMAEKVTRKLDILTKALHVPAKRQGDFNILKKLLLDRHHLRHFEAMDWLDSSPFRGNNNLLSEILEQGMEMLDHKSEEIFDEMERITGLQFNRDARNIDPNLNWYALGTPVRRGEDFVRVFNNETKLANKLKRLTYFMVRSAWDAEYYRTMRDRYYPSERHVRNNCEHLASLYFDLEYRIEESTKPEGEVLTAIHTDLNNGVLSEAEADEAYAWAKQNKLNLRRLKLEVFQTLAEQKRKHPDLVLPEKLEALIAQNERNVRADEAVEPPKITIVDLNREMEKLEERSDVPDGSLLTAWCTLRRKVLDRRRTINGVGFLRRLRESCSNFTEYEEKLLSFSKAEESLETLRKRCETGILDCRRAGAFEGVEEEVVEEAFEVVVDHMLSSLKRLNYEAISAEDYRDLFDQALILEPETGMKQLDLLLREIHAIPRRDLLLQSLGDWESILQQNQYKEKQYFVLRNELELQRLVDDIRAELRERIGQVPFHSRRLRFEVFSLADAYVGNLRTLLDGLLRMAPELVSEVEGRRLVENIQSVESQILEAQKQTRLKGEAYRRLQELERSKLLPDALVEELKQDFADNFRNLDSLLSETNEGLKKVRETQNRFGGDYDTSQFDVTINIDDLERLKEIYNFLENITLMDVKRFGVVYNHKNMLLEDVFRKSAAGEMSVPGEIRAMIDERTYNSFLESRAVPLDLKLNILDAYPEIMEAECQLLVRTLNFVRPEFVAQKSVYLSVVRMLEKVIGADFQTLRRLRRIWTKYRAHLDRYEPRGHKANFSQNRKTMLDHVSLLSDGRFDSMS